MRLKLMLTTDELSHWLPANWPAPDTVLAGTTMRLAGYSQAPFDRLNLAIHVTDDAKTVQKNREFLRESLHLPAEPFWLKQVHGNAVINGHSNVTDAIADGIYTDQPGIVCAVLTADCIPLLLCNNSGTEIAAVHVGWRGLCANIIEHALQQFTVSHAHLLAWLGPHISALNYQVGNDVREACLQSLSDNAAVAFKPASKGHWYADLESMVRTNLNDRGISNIFSCNRCTFNESGAFFSYRKKTKTGRMASLIWMRHSNIG